MNGPGRILFYEGSGGFSMVEGVVEKDGSAAEPQPKRPSKQKLIIKDQYFKNKLL